MNLNRLYELQRELDQTIVKKKGLEGQHLLPMKILALQVELGELANEWRGFKFWSKNQAPRTEQWVKCWNCNGGGIIIDPNWIDQHCTECHGRGQRNNGKNPLLEEYVDCLHFILSIGLEIGIKSFIYLKPSHFEGEAITNMFIRVGEFTCLMIRIDVYNRLFEYFIDLGFMLGFTWEQIEQAYIDKNEVNHQRQEQGY
jgi:dimeric dUTPase (all-alpha-NTP-PPase superfamily)